MRPSPPSSAMVSRPHASTPDPGPRHRGGAFSVFVAAGGLFAAAAAGSILFREGALPWAFVAALLGLAAAARATWCILEHWIHRVPLPRAHAVLAGALGFEIACTCRDVAATVFFDPDELAPGRRTRLLCFLENYAARRREAVLEIGPHPHVGLNSPMTVSLPLAPGEAGVYVLPLGLLSATPEGEHDLPVRLKVRKPSGTGARLATPRRHLHDVWTVRFAAPFTVTARPPRPAAVVVAETEAPRYLSLASLSAPAPDFSALQTLLGG